MLGPIQIYLNLSHIFSLITGETPEGRTFSYLRFLAHNGHHSLLLTLALHLDEAVNIPLLDFEDYSKSLSCRY